MVLTAGLRFEVHSAIPRSLLGQYRDTAHTNPGLNLNQFTDGYKVLAEDVKEYRALLRGYQWFVSTIRPQSFR